jgi:hypothetical protein
MIDKAGLAPDHFYVQERESFSKFHSSVDELQSAVKRHMG